MNSKKCRVCDVELIDGTNWTSSIRHKLCREHYTARMTKYNPKYNPVENAKRMWVNGKYVSRKHPMHKPGRYTANEGSFFDVVPEDSKALEGWVYIITNEAWPEWVKVGMADDPEKRLSGYQTSSPMRDYALFEAYNVGDRRAAEKAAHDILKGTYTKKGEWFKCNPAVADVLIRGTMSEY